MIKLRDCCSYTGSRPCQDENENACNARGDVTLISSSYVEPAIIPVPLGPSDNYFFHDVDSLI